MNKFRSNLMCTFQLLFVVASSFLFICLYRIAHVWRAWWHIDLYNLCQYIGLFIAESKFNSNTLSANTINIYRHFSTISNILFFLNFWPGFSFVLCQKESVAIRKMIKYKVRWVYFLLSFFFLLWLKKNRRKIVVVDFIVCIHLGIEKWREFNINTSSSKRKLLVQVKTKSNRQPLEIEPFCPIKYNNKKDVESTTQKCKLN